MYLSYHNNKKTFVIVHSWLQTSKTWNKGSGFEKTHIELRNAHNKQKKKNVFLVAFLAACHDGHSSRLVYPTSFVNRLGVSVDGNFLFFPERISKDAGKSKKKCW
jgi:hypothetical protein